MDLRDNDWEENAVENEHDNASGHDKHSAWVELPSWPFFGIVASKGGESRVPIFVLLTKALCSMPRELDCYEPNYSLNYQVNSDNSEPSLSKYAIFKRHHFLFFQLSYRLLNFLRIVLNQTRVIDEHMTGDCLIEGKVITHI